MQEIPHTFFPTRGQRYLGRAEAAQYIRSRYGFPCSRQWLAELAVLGGGPIFRKATRLPTLMIGQWPGSASRSNRPPMCRPIAVHRS